LQQHRVLRVAVVEDRPQPGQIAGRRSGLAEDRPQDEREDERHQQVDFV
jgi:hypothetical protein